MKTNLINIVKSSLGLMAVFTLTYGCSSDDSMLSETTESTFESIEKAACRKGYNWLDAESKNSSHWKLQYANSSNTIEATRTSTSNSLLTLANDKFDMVGTNCDRLRFKVNANDATTSGSSNPRCELREMTVRSGSSEKTAGWSSNTSNTKRLTIKAQVRELTNTNKVGVAQYHSGNDDTVIAVVYKSGSKYILEMEGDGIASSSHQILNGNYMLGDTFTINIEVNANRVRWSYNGGSYSNWKSIVNDTKYRTTKSYFKAGAYALNSPTSGSCRVEFSQILINRSEAY